MFNGNITFNFVRYQLRRVYIRTRVHYGTPPPSEIFVVRTVWVCWPIAAAGPYQRQLTVSRPRTRRPPTVHVQRRTQCAYVLCFYSCRYLRVKPFFFFYFSRLHVSERLQIRYTVTFTVILRSFGRVPSILFASSSFRPSTWTGRLPFTTDYAIVTVPVGFTPKSRCTCWALSDLQPDVLASVYTDCRVLSGHTVERSCNRVTIFHVKLRYRTGKSMHTIPLDNRLKRKALESNKTYFPSHFYKHKTACKKKRSLN